MPDYTSKLNLKKPLGNEYAEIDDINQNMQAIEDALGVKIAELDETGNVPVSQLGNAPSSPVQSVAGKTGDVVLGKDDVGLGNVDNTSDVAKPISTATQTALNGKAASSHAHGAGDITSGTLAVARGGTGQTTLALARSAMGLGNTTGALPVANGGTAATTVAAARTNLGVVETRIYNGEFQYYNGGWKSVGMITTKPRAAAYRASMPASSAWTTVLSVSGKGILNRISAYSGRFAQTLGARVTIDGVIYDLPAGAQARGRSLGGGAGGGSDDNTLEFVLSTCFNSSLKVEVQNMSPDIASVDAHADYSLV